MVMFILYYLYSNIKTFIRDNNLTELTDVLDMTVPGEEVTVGEKILPGFTENTIVNP